MSREMDEVVAKRKRAREHIAKYGMHKDNVPAETKREFLKQWVKGSPAPAPPKKTLMQKAAAFMAAVSGPRTSDEEYERRMAACKTCPHAHPWQGHLFCRACGCGRWHMARLDIKLRFENLECPADKW